jgi:hypothetical protein
LALPRPSGVAIGMAPPGRGAMLNVNCHWSYRVAPRYERMEVSSLLLRTPIMPAEGTFACGCAGVLLRPPG